MLSDKVSDSRNTDTAVVSFALVEKELLHPVVIINAKQHMQHKLHTVGFINRFIYKSPKKQARRLSFLLRLIVFLPSFQLNFFLRFQFINDFIIVSII